MISIFPSFFSFWLSLFVVEFAFNYGKPSFCACYSAVLREFKSSSYQKHARSPNLPNTQQRSLEGKLTLQVPTICSLIWNKLQSFFTVLSRNWQAYQNDNFKWTSVSKNFQFAFSLQTLHAKSNARGQAYLICTPCFKADLLPDRAW